MGSFKGINMEWRGVTVREPGTYRVVLAGLQAGRLRADPNTPPKPVLRAIFEDGDWRVNAVVNIPIPRPIPGGGYGIPWNQRSHFWSLVGALWGERVTAEKATLLDLDIPGVSEPSDLYRLPLLFTPGEEPIDGVVITMGREIISQYGRPLMITVVKRPWRDTEINSVVDYAPVAPVDRPRGFRGVR